MKDFASLSLGEFGGKLIGFVAAIYLARVILPDGFGILGYAAAFLSYLILFVDFGLDTIGAKRIANNFRFVGRTVNNILAFRLMSSVIIFIAAIVIIVFLKETGTVKYALILISLNVFVQAVSLDYVFQAAGKFNVISIKTVVKNLIYLLLILLFVRTPSDVLSVIADELVARKKIRFHIRQNKFLLRFEINKRIDERIVPASVLRLYDFNLL